MLSRLLVKSELLGLCSRWIVDAVLSELFVWIACYDDVAFGRKVVHDGRLHLLVSADVSAGLNTVVCLLLFSRVVLREGYYLLKIFVDCFLG